MTILLRYDDLRCFTLEVRRYLLGRCTARSPRYFNSVGDEQSLPLHRNTRERNVFGMEPRTMEEVEISYSLYKG